MIGALILVIAVVVAVGSYLAFVVPRALSQLRHHGPVVRADLAAIRAGFVAEHEALQAAKARQALDAPAELGLETL